MSLSYKTAHLTKPAVILLFCLAILIGYILIWLLVGDINLLHLQWLIPYKGAEWSGKVTTLEKATDVFNTYKSDLEYWYPSITSPQDFLNYVNENYPNGVTILSSTTKLNGMIFLPMVLLLVFAITIPLILRIFKLMQIDILTFSITISITAFSFIVLGLIPHTFGNGWIWLTRIISSLAILIFSFFIFNNLINYIIGSSLISEQTIIDITSAERERNQSRQTLNELKDQYKKQDDLTYVETDKED